jgi:putative ABC transport system permease protein
MFKNFLKIAYRNLFKYKYYSIINILGFAVGIAVFSTAYLYAVIELSYDKFHEKSDRIFRVANIYEKDNTTNSYAVTPFPLANTLQKEYPDLVESTCRIFNLLIDYHLINHENIQNTEKNFYYADSSLFHLFDFSFKLGNQKNMLLKPNTVIISESMQKKYFSNENPIGKIIFVNDIIPLSVEGVFYDHPNQSHIRFDFITSSSTFFSIINEPETWLWSTCWTYVLLKETSGAQKLMDKLPEFALKHFDEDIREFTSLFLQPLRDIHLNSDLESEVEPNNKSLYIYILFTISIFLLFVSCINFINLSIVGSITRIREISIRKIMGSSRKLITYQFIIEAVMLSTISFIASLFIIEGLLPAFTWATNHELKISMLVDNNILPKVLVLSLLISLGVGIYTGLYASSFPIFNIGRFKYRFASGKWFSGKILIVVQYSISLILLIAVIVNFRQLIYLKNKDLGFIKDKIILFQVANNPIAYDYEKFKNAISHIDNIEGVTGSNHIIGTQCSYRRYFYQTNNLPRAQFFPELIVRHDFINTLGIQILEGYDFLKGSTEDITASSDEIIINESLVKHLGYQSNSEAIHKGLKSFKGNERIVGVIKDFNSHSLHKPVGPIIIRLSQTNFSAWEDTKYIFVKFKNKIKPEDLKTIEQEWLKIAPNWPFEYKHLDQVLNEQYSDEESLNFFLWVFSGLVLVIGSMGVWAVSSLVSIQKTKEIGIRKAIGASITDIILLFIKDFIHMLIIANIVAWPVSWIIIKLWLKNFAIHIDFNWYYFVSASLFILLLTLAIILKHALKIAQSDTVKALRYE